MTTYNITNIQLFDYAIEFQKNEEGERGVRYSYSANIAINDSFIVQVSGDSDACKFNIPASDIASWSGDEAQDNACDNIDSSELLEYLEQQGFENNIGWLSENATDVMIPENAQYRFDNDNN